MKQEEEILNEPVPVTISECFFREESQVIIDHSEELPSVFSERIARKYSDDVSKEKKKFLGQFFTPLTISNYMASMIEVNCKRRNFKILDPGCGALTLSCSVVEKLVSTNPEINSIEIDAYDLDSGLSDIVLGIIEALRVWAAKKGVQVSVKYQAADFLLENEDKVSFGASTYDIVISNPPYFKVGKDDLRLKPFKDLLKGQQNIYSLFLLASSNLLKKDGQLIFIVPRSFTSGLYFESFRNLFFKKMDVRHFHLFDSRSAGFKRDQVLQENVIFKAERRKKDSNVRELLISYSIGLDDLNKARTKKYRSDNLMKSLGRMSVIHLPSSVAEENAMKTFSLWKNSLLSFGMRASTGPVVPFRSKSYLLNEKSQSADSVPLLWMHNCSKMKLNWPVVKEGKAAWIKDNELSNSRTLLNQNYVLLRRFSSKDDQSKLVATPYLAENFSYDRIGLENHMNYVYMPEGHLDKIDVYGLAVLFNSKLFDDYFRSLSGNTQVSATELNHIPLPDLAAIRKIGKSYLSVGKNRKCEIDNIVNKAFDVALTDK